MNSNKLNANINENLLFDDEEFFYPYLAGLFDASSNIIIGQYGGLVLNLNGSYDFLIKINDNIENTGTIVESSTHHLQFFGNRAVYILEKILPFLIIKKEQVLFAINYQNHINKRESFLIDDNERQYRLDCKEKIKKLKIPENIDFFSFMDYNWVFPYLLGYIDSKLKINIKKHTRSNNTQYWLKAGLYSEYEDFLFILSEYFNMGYVVPSWNVFRWELTNEDAFNLLNQLYPFLINKGEQIEIGIEFYEFIKGENEDNLDQEKINYIEKLKSRISTLGKKRSEDTDFVNITILICKELMNLIDSFSEKTKMNRSQIMKESLKSFFKINPNIDFESICLKSPKKYQINANIEKDILNNLNLNKTKSRSELIRKAIEYYINENTNMKNSIPNKILKEEITEQNPLKLLKKIR